MRTFIVSTALLAVFATAAYAQTVKLPPADRCTGRFPAGPMIDGTSPSVGGNMYCAGLNADEVQIDNYFAGPRYNATAYIPCADFPSGNIVHDQFC
ncbi:MAG: hypothetical protein ACFBSD_06420 [Paracoccaceae bacterium]